MSIELQTAEITDFTCNGTCSQCGNCCPNILPVTEKEIKRIHAYIKQHNIKPHVIGIPLANTTVDVTCPFLRMDRKTERCSIYPVRPSICRCFICSDKKLLSQIKENKKLMSQDRVKIDMMGTFFPERRKS